MEKISKIHIILTIPLLMTVVSCGNNQDNANNTSTQSTNADSTMTMGGVNTDMTGTGSTGMENMSGMNMQMDPSMESDDMSEPKVTEQGNFQISIESEQSPIPINIMHSWRLHLQTAAGEPVDNALITVAGGMPAHNHGMPTAPQVTQSLGYGDYLVEGVQFQMPGHWVVNLDISANGNSDKISYNLMLQP